MTAEEFFNSKLNNDGTLKVPVQVSTRLELYKIIDQYASTKAEEEAKAFAVFVMQPYITDPLKPEDFEDRYNQYKLSQI